MNNGKENPDFQWGMLPPLEYSGQQTRSMMEMRKPKPFEVN